MTQTKPLIFTGYRIQNLGATIMKPVPTSRCCALWIQPRSACYPPYSEHPLSGRTASFCCYPTLFCCSSRPSRHCVQGIPKHLMCFDEPQLEKPWCFIKWLCHGNTYTNELWHVSLITDAHAREMLTQYGTNLNFPAITWKKSNNVKWPTVRPIRDLNSRPDAMQAHTHSTCPCYSTDWICN